MGCPSPSLLFNRTVDSLLDRSSSISMPRYFVLHLETARFANKLISTMSASLEQSQGVSHRLVAQMEEEYSKIQCLLYPDNSGEQPSYSICFSVSFISNTTAQTSTTSSSSQPSSKSRPTISCPFPATAKRCSSATSSNATPPPKPSSTKPAPSKANLPSCITRPTLSSAPCSAPSACS